MEPICMSEEYWTNSQLSIVRHYGRIKYNGHEFIIVNKLGWDIIRCSAYAVKHDLPYAIAPGEPCDLCRTDFVKYYAKVGRDRFLDVLMQHPLTPDKELKAIYEDMIAADKAKKNAGQAELKL